MEKEPQEARAGVKGAKSCPNQAESDENTNQQIKKSPHNFLPHCQPKRGKFGSALGKGGQN